MEVETIAKSREEYQSDAYQASGRPAAPAVMVGDEIAAQGPEISAEKIEAAIRQYLRLPPVAA